MKLPFGSSILIKQRNWLVEKQPVLLRFAIVAGVLLSSLVIVPNALMGKRLPQLIFLAFVGVAFFLVIAWKPILGFVAILLGGAFIRISLQGGLNASQIGLVILLAVWFLDMFVVKKSFKFVKSRTMLPLLVFIIVSVLAFALGQNLWYPFGQNAPLEAQLGGFAINILSAGAFLLMAHLMRSVRDLEWFTWIFIGLGAVYVLGRFIGFGWVDVLYQGGFSQGSLFWTWLAVLAAGQLVGNRSLSIKKRALLGILLAMTFFVAYVQAGDWKSGWFPPLIGIAAIFGIRYWKITRFFIPLAIIPAFIVITSAITQESWSWGTRLDAWNIVVGIASVSPILGMGFANYYWYTPLFPIRGYAVKFNSHSQFVDLFAQTGLVGLLVFVWFFAEMGVLCLRLLKKVPEGFSKGYLYGALGGVVGTMAAASLVDWVLPFVYNIGMSGFRASVVAWLFMGGIVCIEQVVRNEPSA